MINAEQVSKYIKWFYWIVPGASFVAALFASIAQSEFRPKLAAEGSIVFAGIWILTWLFFKQIRIAPNIKTISPGKQIHFFFVGAIAALWLPYFFKPFQAQKVEIILDVSSRMGAQFDPPGTTKFDAARAGVLTELDILEHQNVKVALRLIQSREVGRCVIEPRGSLAVDFTEDLDKIRDYLKTLHVSPGDKAPVVDAVDFSIDHYQNEKDFDKEFFIYSFLGGDDTCGGKIDLYMNSPKVKGNAVNTDLFLIILLGTDEEDFLKDIPNAKLNFARSAKQVQKIVNSNKQWIVTPTSIISFGLPVSPKDSPTPVATNPVAVVQEKNTETAQPAKESVPQPSVIKTFTPEIPNTGQDTTDPFPASTMTRAASSTPSPTRTSTKTPTRTPTVTSTPTRTPTATPSNTSTKTPTRTPTDPPTETPINTPTDTPTPTPTATSTCSYPSSRKFLQGTASYFAQVTIDNPANCTIDHQPETAIDTHGTYAGIPADTTIWVLVYPPNGLYYPQSPNACSTPSAPPPVQVDNNWSVNTYLGRGGSGPEWFDIVVVLTDQETSNYLSNWLHNGCIATPNNFTGIDPETLKSMNITEQTYITVQTR